jgi:hypothetical protein
VAVVATQLRAYELVLAEFHDWTGPDPPAVHLARVELIINEELEKPQ